MVLIALEIIKLLLNCELAHSTEQGKKNSKKGRENTVENGTSDTREDRALGRGQQGCSIFF